MGCGRNQWMGLAVEHYLLVAKRNLRSFISSEQPSNMEDNVIPTGI